MRSLGNLLLVLVAAAIPCLGAEVFLRLTAPPPDTPELFRKLPSAVEWSGRPHARGVHAGVPVAFNAFGLRDRERSPQPEPGTTRILALGDSVTFGMGVALEDSYPQRTEAILNAARRPDAARVEVLNFGMPGFNTVHQLAQLRELGLQFRPDVVVVGFLYNDVEPSRAQRGSAMPGPQERSLLREAKAAVNGTVLWLKKNSMFFAWLSPRLGMALRPLGFKGFGQVGEVKDQYVDGNPNWQRVRAALAEMKALGEQHQFELVVMIIPAMAKFDDAHYPIKEYHQAVAAFCQANGIKCLDLLPAFWGRDGTRFWISPTDGHPNAEGQRIMAEALARFLEPMLPPAALVATSG